MARTKQEVAEQATDEQPVEVAASWPDPDQPQVGGSYRQNPDTGEIELVHRTEEK